MKTFADMKSVFYGFETIKMNIMTNEEINENVMGHKPMKITNKGTANGTKPVLREVAVLSAYRRNFDLWVKENRKENERYHFVSRVQDVMGRVFHRVEKSRRCVEMPDFLAVEQRCLERVRNLA